MASDSRTRDTRIYHNRISTGKEIPLHSWPLAPHENDDTNVLLWQFKDALQKGNVTRKPENEDTHLQEAKEIIVAKVDVVNSGSGSGSTTTISRLVVLLARGRGVEGDVEGGCLFEEFWREELDSGDGEKSGWMSKVVAGVDDEEDESAAFEYWVEDNAHLLTGDNHVFCPVFGALVTLTFMAVLDQPGRVFKCILLRRLEDVVLPSLGSEQSVKESDLVGEPEGKKLESVEIQGDAEEKNHTVEEKGQIYLGQEIAHEQDEETEGSESSGTLEYDTDEYQNIPQEDVRTVEKQDHSNKAQADTVTEGFSEEAVSLDLAQLKLDDYLKEDSEKSVEVAEKTQEEK